MAARYRTVDAAPSRPPRYSLLVAAAIIDDDHRFDEGIRWLPEWVGDGHVSAIDPSTGNTAARASSIAAIPAELTADPILLWAGEKASTLGSFGRDYVGRVRRKLAATESFQAAKELWDGAVGTPAGATQQYFTSLASDRLTAVGTPVPVGTAFADLEAGLAAGLAGQRGMIHTTPQVLSLAYQARVVVDAGTAGQPLWLTPMGHVVVADAGYSGDGPAGEVASTASQWVMATAMVSVRLGPISMKPRDAALLEAVDYANNDVVVLADRPCVLQWDENVHYAAEVNVGIPLIGGAS